MSTFATKKRGRPAKPTVAGTEQQTEQRRASWRDYYYRSEDLHTWSRAAKQNARHRANLQKITSDLTAEQIIGMFPENGKCPILGLDLDITKGRRQVRPNSATIDRINPDLPYELSNCHVISHLANRAKSHMNLAQAVLMGEWAKRHLQSK